MPAPRHTKAEAARALVAVAPLAARWIERLLAAHDPPLTTPQYLALRAIAREQVSVNELARRAGVSGPAASQLVTALADAGLLDRRTAEDDRRRQEHALTAKGREALASAEALLAGRLASLIGDLPRPEIDALARALPQVEAALSGAAPPRRPPPPPPRPPPPPHRRAPRPRP
jgi:DNA-binding MarR family transcriptional regulator